jgi:hypothetical protein
MEVISRWVFYVGSCLTIGGWVLPLFEWGKSAFFSFLRDNIQVIWSISLSGAALTLWFWISRLHTRFVMGFRDNFTGNLHSNWDFVGPWKIADENTLLVTASAEGGLTKVGALWENYTFTFKARIMRDCLGVIVRAQDLNNYYMFQIRNDKVRPHRRAAYPVIDTSTPVQGYFENTHTTTNPIKFQIGWEVFDPPIPLPRSLDNWFNVKLIVRGESVSLYIDDQLILQKDSFLKIPTGKVGFRNSGREEALIKDVRVKLQI